MIHYIFYILVGSYESILAFSKKKKKTLKINLRNINLYYPTSVNFSFISLPSFFSMAFLESCCEKFHYHALECTAPKETYNNKRRNKRFLKNDVLRYVSIQWLKLKQQIKNKINIFNKIKNNKNNSKKLTQIRQLFMLWQFSWFLSTNKWINFLKSF